MLPALVFAQRTVSGVVNSTEGPLIGVNIQVKGTTLGAISGIDGDYTLEVANANDTLVFSYVGYVTKEEPLAGRTTVNVDLELESELLNEVVVVGYGVAVMTQILIFPIFGLHTTLAQNLQMGLLFTGGSLSRSFLLRRLFEAIRVAKPEG